MEFENKNVLVIGGSSGIGYSIVHALAEQGAQVYNLSRSAGNWKVPVKHLARRYCQRLWLPAV